MRLVNMRLLFFGEDKKKLIVCTRVKIVAAPKCTMNVYGSTMSNYTAKIEKRDFETNQANDRTNKLTKGKPKLVGSDFNSETLKWHSLIFAGAFSRFLS